MNPKINFLGAVLAGLLLTACGGGSSSPADAEAVPEAAMASPAALIDWAGSLPTSETREPLDIVRAMPPTSETDEPLPLR